MTQSSLSSLLFTWFLSRNRRWNQRAQLQEPISLPLLCYLPYLKADFYAGHGNIASQALHFHCVFLCLWSGGDNVPDFFPTFVSIVDYPGWPWYSLPEYPVAALADWHRWTGASALCHHNCREHSLWAGWGYHGRHHQSSQTGQCLQFHHGFTTGMLCLGKHLAEFDKKK